MELNSIMNSLEKQGYAVVPNLLDIHGVSQLSDSLKKLNIERSAFATIKNQRVALNHIIDPFNAKIIAKLLRHKLIRQLTTSYHSKSFVEHTKVLIKQKGSHATAWHQDASFWKEFDPYDTMFTLWIPLHPVNEANGCLKVLSASHKYKLLSHESIANGKELTISVSDFEEVSLKFKETKVEMNSGDGIFFKSKLLHAAFANKSSENRMAFKIVFQDFSKRSLKFKRHTSSIKLFGVEGFINKNFNLYYTRRIINGIK
ncbi:MAG: phytanoyl-CoA dioxygenase family protein [Cyclobacteriaceae bacterium]